MKLFKNDFDKLYEELSTLIEDTEVDTSTIVDMRTLNVDNLSDADWDQIKKASMALCTKFNSDVASWPYQFQLQYNSYQSECLALDLLKDQKVLNKINEMLAKYEATCRVAGSYKFNPNPCEHHILGANSQLIGRAASSADDDNSTVVDIIPADNEQLIPKENSSSNKNSKDEETQESNYYSRVNRIEVKCIAGTKPKGFHNCQIVFVFDILEDTCTVYYFSAGRRQTKHTYVINSVGIRSRCISVKPNLDPTARDEVEITCSRWGTKKK